MWDFALDVDAALSREEVQFHDRILVPFAPEAPASGIAETGLFSACWYRRQVAAGDLGPGERALLHFGAVDYEARVWIDGHEIARHEGGYTPFTVDVTEHLGDGREHELVVRAYDDPSDLEKPRGKQDWKREPHAIWYPRTTGIWQSVWLETVPATHVSGLLATPDVGRWAIAFDAKIEGPKRHEARLRLLVSHDGKVLAEDEYSVDAGEVTRVVHLRDPGPDIARRELLWRPASPTLLDIHAELVIGGEVVDAVRSYAAMRSVAVDGDHFLLNGRPYRLRLVLDQGYWPSTGLTPPDDAALRRDVELVKAMGFNGVRKHQKIEDPQFLHVADTMGLLVFAELPSAYRFTSTARRRLVTTWIEAIERDRGHPSVVAWVPLNESWGVSDLPGRADERDWVRALYHLTRSLDPTRPVIANDGWEAVGGDLLGVHDYADDPDALRERYGGRTRAEILVAQRPGGRKIAVADDHHQPLLLSEFGGISLSSVAGAYGYAHARDAADLLDRYEQLLAVVHELPFAGFCYTQLADTYQETNGLLTADRVPKMPLERVGRATFGPKRPFAHWEEQPTT